MSQSQWSNKNFQYTNNIFNQNEKQFFRAIKEELPPVFTRQVASKAIGGLMSPKTLSNLDSLGDGPPVKIKLGSKVGYERESFVEWLKGKL